MHITNIFIHLELKQSRLSICQTTLSLANLNAYIRYLRFRYKVFSKFKQALKTKWQLLQSTWKTIAHGSHHFFHAAAAHFFHGFFHLLKLLEQAIDILHLHTCARCDTFFT